MLLKKMFLFYIALDVLDSVNQIYDEFHLMFEY